MARTDVYLRGEGEFIFRLLPASVRERVKKVELAVVLERYKPLRPAAMAGSSHGAPARLMPAFVLKPHTRVWVVVTDKELYLLPKGRERIVVTVDYRHVSEVRVHGTGECGRRGGGTNSNRFNKEDVNIHSRTVKICERFMFDTTHAKERFREQIDARRRQDDHLLKEVARIRNLTRLDKYRSAHVPASAGDDMASHKRRRRGGWMRFFSPKAPGPDEEDLATSSGKDTPKHRRHQDEIQRAGRRRSLSESQSRLAAEREAYLRQQEKRSPQQDAKAMGVSLISETGCFSQVLTILTIEPLTFLPFQVSWAVLGSSIRRRRDEKVRRELQESHIAATTLHRYKGISADKKMRRRLATALPWNYLETITLTLSNETAPGRGVAASTGTSMGVIVGAEGAGVRASDALSRGKRLSEGSIPKFCRDIVRDYAMVLKDEYFSLYAADDDMHFLLDMRRVATMFPVFRQICIEAKRVVPALIDRLIRCIDSINERSEQARFRYAKVLRHSTGQSEPMKAWTMLMTKLEKRQVRKQMLALFDALSAILQDSEGVKDRLSLVTTDMSGQIENDLLRLVDVCFEYRSPARVSKDIHELRARESTYSSGGEVGNDKTKHGLFVPRATFDMKLNRVDETFTLKFVDLLFQVFSIYQHAQAAGIVRDFNFLNFVMERVDVSDVDIHGGYIFVLLSRLVFDMKNEEDASVALQLSFVMKMLLSTNKGWQLRSYLKENYAEELRYVLATKAARQLESDIANNCLIAGWSMNTYSQVIDLSNMATGRLFAGEKPGDTIGEEMSTQYDTFGHVQQQQRV